MARFAAHGLPLAELRGVTRFGRAGTIRSLSTSQLDDLHG